MMYLLSFFGLVFSYVGFINKTDQAIFGIALGGAILCFILALNTSEGRFYLVKLFKRSEKNNWIIIQFSGGQVVSHWIIKNSFIRLTRNSVEFHDYICNSPIILKGDLLVRSLTNDMDNLLKNPTYKEEYGIPKKQQTHIL